MTQMRAKVVVTKVESFGGVNANKEYTKHGEKVFFTGVTHKSFDKDGFNEDNTFAKYSPQLDLSITIQNPALFDKHFPQQSFYIDFTLAN